MICSIRDAPLESCQLNDLSLARYAPPENKKVKEEEAEEVRERERERERREARAPRDSGSHPSVLESVFAGPCVPAQNQPRILGF
jgi:hypothetical protein